MKDENKVYYTVKEVQEILGCGKTTAYELFHRKDFPSFRLLGGKKGKILVYKDEFERYMNKLKCTSRV